MQPATISRDHVVSDLKKILAEELFIEVPIDKMKETDALNTDLGLDSVGLVELVSILEERYGLQIEVKDAGNDLATIGSTANYIVRNLPAGRA